MRQFGVAHEMQNSFNFMSDEGKPGHNFDFPLYSILTCPSNSWPLGVLSVFKLVSRKTGASQPPGSWI